MPAETTEFVVVTTEGRILGRHALSYRDLISDLHYDGHTPVYIRTMAEYQADIVALEEQERLHHELQQAIEEERKTA